MNNSTIWKATKWFLAVCFVLDAALWLNAYLTGNNDALVRQLVWVLFDAVLITLCCLEPGDDSDDDKGDGPPLKEKHA